MARSAALMAAKVYVHKSRGFQVRYTLFFPDGTSAVRYRYFPTRPEAESVRRDCDFIENGSRSGNLNSREIVQARHDGLISEADSRVLSGGKVYASYDLKKVVERYLTTISVSHTPVSKKKAEAKSVWIVQWLKGHPIPSLTTSSVKNYVLDRRNGVLVFKNGRSGYSLAGVAPKTIKNELDIMKGLVHEAIVLGMVSENVVKDVVVPLKSSKLRRALNKDEVTRLIACAIDNKRLMHGQIYEFIMVALFTGFRLSELRTLTWDDVNMDTRRIFVQSKEIATESDFNAKSGEARYKSIADSLVPVFDSMERNGRFVFGGKSPYLPEVITAVVKKLMGRAKLSSEFSLHHLRHTYGSWLLRATGGNIKFVQTEMGHLTVTTTQNYMHNIEDITDPARTFNYE